VYNGKDSSIPMGACCAAEGRKMKVRPVLLLVICLSVCRKGEENDKKVVTKYCVVEILAREADFLTSMEQGAPRHPIFSKMRYLLYIEHRAVR
jgi:hypothetical protein